MPDIHMLLVFSPPLLQCPTVLAPHHNSTGYHLTYPLPHDLKYHSDRALPALTISSDPKEPRIQNQRVTEIRNGDQVPAQEAGL